MLLNLSGARCLSSLARKLVLCAIHNFQFTIDLYFTPDAILLQLAEAKKMCYGKNKFESRKFL